MTVTTETKFVEKVSEDPRKQKETSVVILVTKDGRVDTAVFHLKTMPEYGANWTASVRSASQMEDVIKELKDLAAAGERVLKAFAKS